MIQLLKYFQNNRVGLILGSGGARGIAHIPVIEKLDDMGIPLDILVGCSIGSVIGGVYGCGNLEAFKKELFTFDRKKLFSFFDPVFPTSGLIQGEKVMTFLEKFIPLDAKIEDLPFTFGIVATDFYNARTVVFTKGNLHRAIRASISVPGIFTPVRYKDAYLIDGGVTNPLPVNVARSLGAGLTIAVNLNGSPGTGKKRKYYKGIDEETVMVVEDHDIGEPAREKSLAKGSLLELARMSRWFNRTGPSIFETLATSTDIMSYMSTRFMLKYVRPRVYVEPSVNDIRIFDFDRAMHIYEEGSAAIDAQHRILKKRIVSRI